MAKPNPPKNHPKPDPPTESSVANLSKPESGKEGPENAAAKNANFGVNEPAAKPIANLSAGNLGKKESVVNRNKKVATGSARGSSLMPSQHKLENLKAAVAAAGSVDNLLLILQHVDEAGGRQEVAESVEAYRALKLAFE